MSETTASVLASHTHKQTRKDGHTESGVYVCVCVCVCRAMLCYADLQRCGKSHLQFL